MRTLETQMRLRRVIREHQDLAGRLAEAPADAELAAAARHRLAGLIGGLKESWSRESGAEAPDAVRRHVVRSLSGLEAIAARLGLNGGTVSGRQLADFEEAALPLLFLLRGLEAAEPAIGRTA
jgi:hypothetical protein